jgi:hydroxymethylbilane synthase
MSARPLVIGTRGSALALAQTEIIGQLLQSAHPDLQIERKIIKTSGDQFHNLSLVKGGGKGLFTKEIEEQLLRGEIDVAVHSLKDLPTKLPDGLILGAVPKRADPHDIFVGKTASSLEKLRGGATVATSSLRRKAQLLLKKADLNVVEIRGNVETRLRKLREIDKLDALILAAAGLERLNLRVESQNFHAEMLDFSVMLPAIGQGAIGCEARADDSETLALLRAIDDADSHAAVRCERAFLRALGGGCQVPIAGIATISGENLHFRGGEFLETAVFASAQGLKTEPERVGEEAAKQIR